MFNKNPKTNKKPNKFKKIEPVFIRKLADEADMYHRDIGDECGVSESTISTALRNNTVYCPIEKAAELAWRNICYDGPKNALHELMPNADEINLSYFKSNGHWAMWASRDSLVDKDDGQRIKETFIFAREDGATPLECIEKHYAPKEKV